MPVEFLNALAKGTRLHEYEIVRVLGAGGFGITYLAFDNNLEKPVAIKEFLPNELALRHEGDSVTAKSTGAQDEFDHGLKQFMGEARIMAKFNHPNIVRVQRFFDANNTGYIVMDYAEGRTLSDIIKKDGPMDEASLRPILLAIGDGLKRAHEAGILHRDIKPGNLILMDDGTPVLIDFGAARAAIGAHGDSVTSIVTPGYAPIEQYDTGGKQGPWSDIYGLGAVAYVALTGDRPPDATGRIRADNMVPVAKAAADRGSPYFLAAIDWALRPAEEDRPQNIDDWVAALKGQRAPSPDTHAAALTSDDDKTVALPRGGVTPTPRNHQTPRAQASDHRGYIPFLVGAAMLIGGGFLVYPHLQDMLGKDTDQRTSGTNAEIASADEGVSSDMQLEADAWVRAGTSDTMVSYRAYLSAFPRGPHADEAQTRIRELQAAEDMESERDAWRVAEQTNSIEGYLDYLSRYPNGLYMAEANSRLTSLSAHDGAAGRYFANTDVNMREWPSTSANRAGSVAGGVTLDVAGSVRSRDWYAVRTPEGQNGYIHSSLLTAFAGAQDPEQTTQTRTAESAERQDIRRRWLDAIRRRGN